VRINFKFRAVYKAKPNRQHKATQEIRPVEGKAHPKVKAIRPQSSDNPKHGKQTATTAITTTRNAMLELLQ